MGGKIYNISYHTTTTCRHVIIDYYLNSVICIITNKSDNVIPRLEQCWCAMKQMIQWIGLFHCLTCTVRLSMWLRSLTNKPSQHLYINRANDVRCTGWNTPMTHNWNITKLSNGHQFYQGTMLLLLLVWQAPLGMRSTKRRHQSPEWTILSHSYCLIQVEIVRPQVLLDSLHTCSSRTSWWSPPVLRRGSSYDTPGICLVWHSRNVAEQRKTPCLDNSWQAWLLSRQ